MSRPRSFAFHSFRTLALTIIMALSISVLAACTIGDNAAPTADADTGATESTATTVVERTANQVATVTNTVAAAANTPTQTAETVPATAPVTVFEGYADLVEAVNPAVVTVINERTFSGGAFGQQTDPQTVPAGTGTGFIISEDGYIITNNHVVEGSDQLQVIFYDGTAVDAELIGTDPFTDLAVVKVNDPVPGVVNLGDSDALRPGDRVIAIGSPLGEYTNTVTEGIVSGLNRDFPTGNGAVMQDMIQHDAAINPGNSGGPLFDIHGNVIGVNTLVVRQSSSGIPAEGLGFAIPSNLVKRISDELIATGRIDRPYLGITFQMLNPRLATSLGLDVENGALVTELANGPAAEAGVQVNDVITAINGEEITPDNSLVEILFQYSSGDTVTLSIYRNGETLELDVTLASRPANP